VQISGLSFSLPDLERHRRPETGNGGSFFLVMAYELRCLSGFSARGPRARDYDLSTRKMVSSSTRSSQNLPTI